MKLYDLTQSYVGLLDMADTLDEETFLDTLSSISEALEDKVEHTAKFIRCLESDMEALKVEEKRLADKRKVLENKVISIKEYLQHEMEFSGIEKVKRPTITVSIQLNPPSVTVLDESLIPDTYIIPQPGKLDKKSILKSLKDGEEVPGCDIEQSRSLRIK